MPETPTVADESFSSGGGGVDFACQQEGFTDVLVMGGGIAGVMTALKLADEGKKVVILERLVDILLGSSNRTPGRMGAGFHYFHKETAIMLLHSTINFLRQYPEYVVGHAGYDIPNPTDKDYYLRRGEYFVVKGSIMKSRKIHEVYDALEEEYRKSVEEYERDHPGDPKARILGDPEDFYEELDVDEIANGKVNSKVVKWGIRTCEELMDWPKFREHLLSEIKKHSNITVVANTEVQTIERVDDRMDVNFRVVAKDGDGKNLVTERVYEAETVINSTWERIAEFNAQLGHEPPENESARTTNRLKALAHVKLPPDLSKAASMFFAFGPHAMFSAKGLLDPSKPYHPDTNYYHGYLTYAPDTNDDTSTEVEVPAHIRNALDGKDDNHMPVLKYLAFVKRHHISNNEISISQYLESVQQQDVVDDERFSLVVLNNVEQIQQAKVMVPTHLYNRIAGRAEGKAAQASSDEDEGPSVISMLVCDYIDLVEKERCEKGELSDTDLKEVKLADTVPQEARFVTMPFDTFSKIKGQQIIDGVSRYIPDMAKSTLLGVGPDWDASDDDQLGIHSSFGIVQSPGEVDIYDHNSQVHQRDEHGVVGLEIGFAAVPSRKLLYGLETAEKAFAVYQDQSQFKGAFKYAIQQPKVKQAWVSLLNEKRMPVSPGAKAFKPVIPGQNDDQVNTADSLNWVAVQKYMYRHFIGAVDFVLSRVKEDLAHTQEKITEITSKKSKLEAQKVPVPIGVGFERTSTNSDSSEDSPPLSSSPEEEIQIAKIGILEAKRILEIKELACELAYFGGEVEKLKAQEKCLLAEGNFADRVGKDLLDSSMTAYLIALAERLKGSKLEDNDVSFLNLFLQQNQGAMHRAELRRTSGAASVPVVPPGPFSRRGTPSPVVVAPTPTPTLA